MILEQEEINTAAKESGHVTTLFGSYLVSVGFSTRIDRNNMDRVAFRTCEAFEPSKNARMLTVYRRFAGSRSRVKVLHLGI